MKEIYRWWVQDNKQWLRQYERRIYPNGHPPPLSTDIEQLRSDTQSRHNWLTLFSLGIFHTIGWAIPQKHGNFLRMCRRHGWFQKFADPDRQPEQWISVLDEYLNKPIDKFEYYQWMKQFTSIYHIASRLPDYVEAFLSINKYNNRPFSPDQILRPQTNPDFQGGGPDTPPIDPALGIGVCFVLRELVRLGKITNSQVYQYCYVPVGQVRRLLSPMGCQGLDEPMTNRWERSSIIYHFLQAHLDDRATFDMAFDLPLLAYVERENGQEQFSYRQFSDAARQEDDYEDHLEENEEDFLEDENFSGEEDAE